MKRNRAIDYEKGIIVAAMVFCHVVDFMGDRSLYPGQQWIMTLVGALAFPTFVFAYGRSVYLAYYSRDFRTAAPRMLGSAARSYLAYCISGVAFNVMSNEKTFAYTEVKRVFLLKDIPGMSEFLIAFALFALAALVLWPAMKKLLEHPRIYWAVTFALFLSAFVPYGRIRDPRLGLLIGSERFCLFPILQYFPFFMAGLYVSKYGMNKKLVWLTVSAVLTGVSAVYTAVEGVPNRFPPELLWLIMPCFVIVALDMLGELANRWSSERRWARRLLSPVESMGRNSLYYLLASNLVLFAYRCMTNYGASIILPAYRAKAKFPFNLETGSTPFALFWSLVLLLCLGFTAGLCRRAPKD